jgi:gamma-D-glutamyl-L-lysine dipeptidyl-peptidase
MADVSRPDRDWPGVTKKGRGSWLRKAATAAVAVAIGVTAAWMTSALEHAGGAAGGSRPRAAVAVSAAARPQPCTSGTCYVAVSVATMWARTVYPRPVDKPALANPADPRGWVRAMTVAQKSWLVGKLESQVVYGTKVIVIGHQGTGWIRIAVPSQPTPRDGRGYPGYVPARQLTSTPPPAAGTTAIVRQPTVWLWSGWTAAGPTGSKVIDVSYGTVLPVVEATPGYVVVKLIGGREVAVRPGYVVLHAPGQAWGATGAKLVAEARKFLGLQYLWAGTSGFGFDCSGFTRTIYAGLGTQLPRDADRQAVHGTPVASGSLQPGDLVFFRSGASGPIIHVGMYVGGGNMIDAPHTGAPVRIEPVRTFGNYAGARRYLAQ